MDKVDRHIEMMHILRARGMERKEYCNKTDEYLEKLVEATK